MDHRREREVLVAAVEIALALACGIALVTVSGRVAQGEQKRASSTVYAQDLKDPPRYRKYRSYRKYRYSYRRSRSRTAAVNSRAASVVEEPASRAVPEVGGVGLLPLVGTPAGQLLLTSDWPASLLMPPYQKSTKSENVEEPLAQWHGGEVMLEREGGEEVVPRGSNSLHLIPLGAIAAAFVAFLYFAVSGEEHEQPAPKWSPWPDA